MAHRFEIVREILRDYRRFGTVGRQFTVRPNPPIDRDLNPIDYFLAIVNDLFEHLLHGVQDSDMMGVAIRNEVNHSDKPIGLSFRRRNQMSGDVIWSVFEKVSQSNSRSNALDTLTIEVHAVKMPVGFGRFAIKTKGRPLTLIPLFKISITGVKVETNCLAHALIIAIVKITKDPNYALYRKGYKINQVRDNLLATTDTDLRNGEVFPNSRSFNIISANIKSLFILAKIANSIMFEGKVETSDRINLLYDETARHYHVIGNLTGAMAKKFVSRACTKRCSSDIMNTCDQTCSDCMASPPCVQAEVRYSCTDCNLHFRSQAYFDNHKMKRGNKKSVCERKRFCPSCNEFIEPSRIHECGKHYCKTCNAHKEKQHLCYIQPLKNVLPSGDGVMFVFYDFETTQDPQYSDMAGLHVPYFVCIQQFCSREGFDNIDENCIPCGKRKQSFWEDPVGDLISYLCEDRPWCKQIIFIAHNAKAFDLHFILKRAIFLKWQQELIMRGQKIMCMKMEHLKFIDSFCFFPFPLRNLSAAFGLTASISWYPHYFNKAANLDYVGHIPDAEYYGVNEMGVSERTEFLAWYEEKMCGLQ
jgi:hypothetical protein